jgi:hypothetical protein
VSDEHELANLVAGMMNTMGELRKVIASQREMIINQGQTLAGIAALLKVHGVIVLHEKPEFRKILGNLSFISGDFDKEKPSSQSLVDVIWAASKEVVLLRTRVAELEAETVRLKQK